MILADDEAARRAALDRLLPFQQSRLRGHLRGDGRAAGDDPAARPTAARVPARRSTRRPTSACASAIRALREANPMLGTRGCRLGIQWPGDLRDAGARDRARRARRADRTGGAPHVEIMHPLVAFAEELRRLRELTIAESPRRRAATSPYLRRDDDRAPARLRPGRRDRPSRRLLLVRHERPDADGARLVPRRRRGQVPDRATSSDGVLAHDPFATLDQEGVGELMRIAVERGRAANAGLKIGICGEHGGDPGICRGSATSRPRLRLVLAVPCPGRAARGGSGGAGRERRAQNVASGG